MKSYQDVVNNRFETDHQSPDSIYSPNHPIGKYISKTLFSGLDLFINRYSDNYGELNTKRLLDVGCGTGKMSDYFTRKGFSPQNAVGVDLSRTRTQNATNLVHGVQREVINNYNRNLNQIH